jgi:hypothetical protein
MRVTYEGPHDAVEIPAAGLTVARGETVEVPDEIGASLLRQGTFTEVRGGRVTKEEGEP